MPRINDALEYLRAHHPEALEEVQFHFDLEGEPDEPREWHHAFVDAFVQAEDLGDRPLVRAYREALIHVGWYTPMTAWDLKHSTTTRGTVWEFKKDRVPYWSRVGGDLRTWLAGEGR
jgi:hypothetical protein